jgi:hypothetical protein
MSYHGTPFELIAAQAFSFQSWYSASSLTSLLRALDQLNFPITDQRSTGLTWLSQFSSPPPVTFLSPDTPDTRFLPTGIYLATADPVISALFSQLRGSLSYKDRLMEKTTVGNTTMAISSNNAPYLAALHTFTRALANLHLYSSGPGPWYDRLTFEDRFSLTWS